VATLLPAGAQFIELPEFSAVGHAASADEAVVEMITADRARLSG